MARKSVCRQQYKWNEEKTQHDNGEHECLPPGVLPCGQLLHVHHVRDGRQSWRTGMSSLTRLIGVVPVSGESLRISDLDSA